MEQKKSPVTLYRFDSPAMELALQAVLFPVLFVGILGIAWAFQNEAASVVAISLVSAGVIYFLEWIGREKLILSDDTNRVEIAADEKALLRTVERLPWDSERVRLGIGAAGAGSGCAAGFALHWAGIGPILPTCLAGMVSFFSIYVVYMLMDQKLAVDYVRRGHAALQANDLAAAIGDASESLILSLAFCYEAYMIRGSVWMRLKVYERAVSEFNRALAERPDSKEARVAFDAAVRRRAESEGENWEEVQREMEVLLS